MQKPLEQSKPVTKGLTENQYNCIKEGINVLATSKDNRVKAATWRSINNILEYIKK